MKLRDKTFFHIKCLNQEKILNEASKVVLLNDIERISPNETVLSCSFFQHKKLDKLLQKHNINVLSKTHKGVAHKFLQIFRSYGILFAFVLFFVVYFVQSGVVWQYQVSGTSSLSSAEVVDFVKQNFSKQKAKMDTKQIELKLVENFEEVSFVSCIIKGQTLVINIKEKLMPDEIYGDFLPIVSQKYAKITEIELVSGTLNVKVGDVVKKGDVLVEPYTIDTSGNIKQVEAKAKIIAEVYNEGSVEHFAEKIEIVKTGNFVEKNKITLFGLEIYSYEESCDFQMQEVFEEEVELTTNLPLPFKMTKTKIYELREEKISTNFEDVKEEYIEKARQKALANCKNCDTIVDEFYTIRHISGITIVNFCVTTQEEIGDFG